MSEQPKSVIAELPNGWCVSTWPRQSTTIMTRCLCGPALDGIQVLRRQLIGGVDAGPIASVETQTTMLFQSRMLKRQSYAVSLHGKPR